MKNINQIIKYLQKLGFRIEFGEGSLIKIYPLDSSMPFYSCHIGEKALHPLKRFARKNWNLDITKL